MAESAAPLTHPHEVGLSDWLTDIARKERRNLLALSAIGLFAAKAGLVPAKISALGIDFDHADQANFRIGVAIVIPSARLATLIRVLFDFPLPIAVGVYACSAVIP